MSKKIKTPKPVTPVTADDVMAALYTVESDVLDGALTELLSAPFIPHLEQRAALEAEVAVLNEQIVKLVETQKVRESLVAEHREKTIKAIRLKASLKNGLVNNPIVAAIKNTLVGDFNEKVDGVVAKFLGESPSYQSLQGELRQLDAQLQALDDNANLIAQYRSEALAKQNLANELLKEAHNA